MPLFCGIWVLIPEIADPEGGQHAEFPVTRHGTAGERGRACGSGPGVRRPLWVA